MDKTRLSVSDERRRDPQRRTPQSTGHSCCPCLHRSRAPPWGRAAPSSSVPDQSTGHDSIPCLDTCAREESTNCDDGECCRLPVCFVHVMDAIMRDASGDIVPPSSVCDVCGREVDFWVEVVAPRVPGEDEEECKHDELSSLPRAPSRSRSHVCGPPHCGSKPKPSSCAHDTTVSHNCTHLHVLTANPSAVRATTSRTGSFTVGQPCLCSQPYPDMHQSGMCVCVKFVCSGVLSLLRFGNISQGTQIVSPDCATRRATGP